MVVDETNRESWLRKLKAKNPWMRDKTGNLFKQPQKDRFWPDDLVLEPDNLEHQHIKSIA